MCMAYPAHCTHGPMEALDDSGVPDPGSALTHTGIALLSARHSFPTPASGIGLLHFRSGCPQFIKTLVPSTADTGPPAALCGTATVLLAIRLPVPGPGENTERRLQTRRAVIPQIRQPKHSHRGA